MREITPPTEDLKNEDPPTEDLPTEDSPTEDLPTEEYRPGSVDGLPAYVPTPIVGTARASSAGEQG